MKSCNPRNKKERMLINRGFSIYMPEDEDMKEERHRQFLMLDKRVDFLTEQLQALEFSHYSYLKSVRKAVARYKNRRKKIADEIAEIRVTIGNWGY